MARDDPCRGLHAAATEAELDDVGVRAEAVALDGDPEAARGLRSHEGGVVPGQLGERLRHLLKPAVVGVAPIVDRWVGPERDLQPRLHRPRRGPGPISDRHRRRGRRDGRQARDNPVVQRAAPRGLEIAPHRLRAPVFAEEVVPGPLGTRRERGQHLVGGLGRRIEGRDERLEKRHRPVDGARVAPGLEGMGLGHLPVTALGGLVVVEPEMDAERHLVHPGGEVEVGGRGEDRVASEDHEKGDRPAVHVGGEIPERRELIDRTRLHRRGVEDRLSHVAELRVDRVREGVDGRGLVLPRDHHRGAGVRVQVLGEGGQPGRAPRAGAEGGRGLGARSDAGRQRPREVFDLGRLQRKTVVGQRPRQRRGALHRVEAVHLLLAALQPPPGGELADVPQVGRAVGDEVGVEAHDDVGIQAVLRLHRPAEGEHRPRPRGVTPGGLPLVPLRAGEFGEEALDLRGESGRRDGLGEQPDPRPLERPLSVEGRLHAREERPPRKDLADVGEGLRAVGIVEVEDRRLPAGVGGAEARRVVGVAFDLGGTAEVALDEDALGVAAVEDRGGEEERASGDHVLRRLHVGDDLLLRLAGAAGEAGERQRSAHQRQELPAAEGIVEERGLFGELAPEHLLDRRVAGELLQALPVRPPSRAFQTATHPRQLHGNAFDVVVRVARHRWHVEQLVRVWMPYSFTSRLPSASWSAGGS